MPSGRHAAIVTSNQTIQLGWDGRGDRIMGSMRMIKLSGGKPVAASIKAGLDKMLASEQQPQSGE